jgi:hypothetical protein
MGHYHHVILFVIQDVQYALWRYGDNTLLLNVVIVSLDNTFYIWKYFPLWLFVVLFDPTINRMHLFLRLMNEVEIGMNDSYTWIFEVCSRWKLRIWLLVYLKFFPLMESLKDVCLVSIIRHLLTLEKRGEHKTSWSWFTMIYVASIYLP